MLRPCGAQWLIQWSSVPPTGDHTDTKLSKNEFFSIFGKMDPNLGVDLGGPKGTKNVLNFHAPSTLKNKTLEFFNFDRCVIGQMVPNFHGDLGGSIGSQKCAQISCPINFKKSKFGIFQF